MRLGQRTTLAFWRSQKPLVFVSGLVLLGVGFSMGVPQSGCGGPSPTIGGGHGIAGGDVLGERDEGDTTGGSTGGTGGSIGGTGGSGGSIGGTNGGGETCIYSAGVEYLPDCVPSMITCGTVRAIDQANTDACHGFSAGSISLYQGTMVRAFNGTPAPLTDLTINGTEIGGGEINESFWSEVITGTTAICKTIKVAEDVTPLAESIDLGLKLTALLPSNLPQETPCTCYTVNRLMGHKLQVVVPTCYTNPSSPVFPLDPCPPCFDGACVEYIGSNSCAEQPQLSVFSKAPIYNVVNQGTVSCSPYSGGVFNPEQQLCMFSSGQTIYPYQDICTGSPEYCSAEACQDFCTGTANGLFVSDAGIPLTPSAAYASSVEPSSIKLSGDAMQPSFSGAPDTLYDVLAATSLEGPWGVVATVLSDLNGNFGFTDTDYKKYTERFYRAELECDEYAVNILLPDGGTALSTQGGPCAAAPKPAPSTDLALTAAPDCSSVALQWNDNNYAENGDGTVAGNNETGVEVMRGLDNGGVIWLASLPPNSTSFTDAAVQSGSGYQYEICDDNESGTTCSPISSIRLSCPGN